MCCSSFIVLILSVVIPVSRCVFCHAVQRYLLSLIIFTHRRLIPTERKPLSIDRRSSGVVVVAGCASTIILLLFPNETTYHLLIKWRSQPATHQLLLLSNNLCGTPTPPRRKITSPLDPLDPSLTTPATSSTLRQLPTFPLPLVHLLHQNHLLHQVHTNLA